MFHGFCETDSIFWKQQQNDTIRFGTKDCIQGSSAQKHNTHTIVQPCWDLLRGRNCEVWFLAQVIIVQNKKTERTVCLVEFSSQWFSSSRIANLSELLCFKKQRSKFLCELWLFEDTWFDSLSILFLHDVSVVDWLNLAVKSQFNFMSRQL